MRSMKQEEDYTPLAFHAETDILNFDPLAPDSRNEVVESIPNNEKEFNMDEYDEVISTLDEFDPFNRDIPGNSSTVENSDSLPRADLLKRSGEVLSNRAVAGKQWIQKNLTSVSSKVGLNAQPDHEISIPNTAVSKDVPHYNSAFTEVGVIEDEISPSEESLLDKSHNRSFSIASTAMTSMTVRENYIKLKLNSRQSEFTELFPFKIFIATWNVNGQLPTEPLAPVLQSCEEPPDIIVFGFQELDLSAEAFLFFESNREDAWLKTIENSLPKNTSYEKLKHVRLVGMMISVYIQSKHIHQVSEVESEVYATGIMGVMGNKGGVSVRLQFHNTSICFINTHLAAHLAEYERRNQDFKEIYNKLQFAAFQPTLKVSQHDMVFWLGDLNYRFDELDTETVKRLAIEKQYDVLFKHDQLNRQMQAKKVFNGFSEGKLLFNPTYKYDPGTDIWDSSEKARAPAWCDRILWRGKHITQLTYRHHPQLKLSDHKPVSSLFHVDVKVVDKVREKKLFEEIVRNLDKRENESLPQVKLGCSEFYFENVQFMEERCESLHIANVGQSPVQFQFIPKLDEHEICKPYLKIQPSAGFIEAGDVQEVDFIILVDKHSASLPMSQGCRLDDILVLHLIGGKDVFVPINGNFIPSVFGSSLKTLTKMYGPISTMSVDTLVQLENSAVSNELESLEIPKELWLMVDHLWKYGMKQENILVQSGVEEHISQIRYHLDTGQGGKLPGSNYSVGEALLLFLESLPEPVIPYMFHVSCTEASSSYQNSKMVISALPESHANVFRYITAFLRELLAHSSDNKLDAKIIAAIFSSVLLRSPSNTKNELNRKAQEQLSEKKSKFLQHFIVNDYNS